MTKAALEGKAALVVGAGSALGREIVRLFAQEGALVVAADDAMPQHAVELDWARTMAVDVTDAQDVERVVDTTLRELGKLDILVNCCGIPDNALSIVEMDDAVWQRVLDVNLAGPFLTSRASIQVMMRNGGGVIVNVAPLAGSAGAKAGAAYQSAERGVVGLTRNTAASYYRSGVRCVAVCPGGRSSAIDDDGKPRPAREQEAQNPGPRDIANAVLFAASDAARYVNGLAIVVDGGWMAH